MAYIPSQELADILIGLGFSETTKTRYPKEFRRMTLQDYTPRDGKRSFRFDKGLYIVFDHANIVINQDGFGMQDMLQWEEKDLKALKTFLRIPKPYRKKLIEDGISILSIPERCEKLAEFSPPFLRKHEVLLKSLFETTK